MLTSNETLNKTIGRINSMQMLIENFPMNILSYRGKRYKNVIEFVIDVLRELDENEILLTRQLIDNFFNVPNAIELYNSVTKLTYKKIKKPTEEQKTMAVEKEEIPTEDLYDEPNYIVVEGTFYYKTEAVPQDTQSDFLNMLEKNVKTIIIEILSKILSCSIIPEIPNAYLDYQVNEAFPAQIPLNLIDRFHFLDIAPTSEIGKNFYNVGDETSNTVFKSNDMNAFIWYAMNRGTRISQNETNKMMWDSRLTSNGYSEYERFTPEQWNEWLSSKKNNTDNWIIYPNEILKSEYYSSVENKNTTNTKPLYPIIQFYPNNGFSGEKTLNYLISRQTYGREKDFNKSLYEFNKDYLDNIRIFSPRTIISSIISELLNTNFNINYSISEKLFEAQINKIIKRAIEKDDITISDCFYSFSNEDYNQMLTEMEIQRYGGKTLNSETSPVIGIEENTGLDMLNEINSTATINEKIETLTKNLYEISTIPSQDASIEVSDNNGLEFNNEWLQNTLMAIIRPLVKALLSPKIMVLFIINFQILGLIKIDDLKDNDIIMELLYKKIVGIIISLIAYIKNKIVEFLLGLFYKKITPILEKVYAIIATERLEYWITLLEEARRCLSGLFSLFQNKSKVITEIDDVNYADIRQEDDIPESSSTC